MPHAINHLEHFLWWSINSKDFWQTALAIGIGAIIAGAIGAYIGGRMATSAAIKAEKQAANDQRERDAENDRRTIHGTLRAIAAELSVLKAQPLEHLTKTLEDRERVRRRFPGHIKPFAITQTDPNRFIVFESNCGVIGRIEDHQLTQHIMSAYSRAKELVDYVNTANREFRHWRLLPEDDHEKEMVRHMLDGLESSLRVGLPKLRSEVDNLLKEIDEYLKRDAGF